MKTGFASWILFSNRLSLSESRHSRRNRSTNSKGKNRKVRSAVSIPGVVRDVETVVSGLLKRANINANEFPVEIGTEVSNGPAVLHIPIAKCRSGAIMPYGGTFLRVLSP